MTDFSFYLPIAKVDKTKRTVSGYATTPALDLDGEIVSLDAIKKALPGYWEWRNIREMHQPKAVGVGQETHIDDNGLWLTAKIVDDDAWNKCVEGVYKGFSIGGKKLAKNGNVITELDWVETSIVDRPANPECKFDVAKKAKEGKDGAYLVKAKIPKDPKSRALSKMAQAVELMSKAAPPAAHDGFSLPAKPHKEQHSPKDPETQDNKAAGACEEHGVVGCKECVDKREFSDKEREEAASTGAAMPGGGYPIENKKDLDNARQAVGRAKNPKATRAHIRNRARALGVKLPDNWKKKRAMKLIKEAEKSAKFLSLVSLSPAPTLPFLDLKGAKAETVVENGLTPVPSLRSSSIPRLRKGSTSRGEKGKDVLSLLNLDLEPLTSEDSMQKAVSNGSGDDLDTAVLNIIKRSMEPSRAQRMSIARGDLKKARMARKEAQDSVKECHAALAKRFMAKMAKAKKPDDDDDEMAETEKVLKSLQKAHSALTTMKTFMKAADSQLAKAAGRSGQRGQEVNDPSSSGTPTGAPAGLKDLSPGAMARAGGGSEPPMYPTEGGVYPGKFAKLADKNGMVPANVIELVAENSRLEGQVALLGKVAPQGPKPYAFDMSKAYGIEPGRDFGSRQKGEILFDNVNPNDLQSDDENVRRVAAAKVAGNYLLTPSFGKSIVDPTFRGKAGMGKAGQ